MTLELQFKIKNDPNLYRYLRENSYWYKELNRDPRSIKQMELEMKNRYKLTTVDKITNIKKSLDMVRTFMDVLR